MTRPSPMPMAAAVARLCPACGLCCNGVLFADVKLRPHDAVARLRAQGLVRPTAGAARRLPQPCVALGTDGRCRVYEERPAMCRAFECGVLRRFAAGRISELAAHRRIEQAKRAARRVHRQLAALGADREDRPLMARYRSVMRQPLDLSAGAGPAEGRGRLLRAMEGLMRQLHAEFLAVPGAPGEGRAPSE